MDSTAVTASAKPPTASDAGKPARRGRLRRWWDTHRLGLSLLIFSFAFIVAYLAPRIFIIIPAGHVGVLFERLWGGTQTDRVYGEGLQIIAPWNTMFIYDERYQQLQHVFSAISKSGLRVGITVSVRYRPKLEYVSLLHKEVGPDYVDVIIIPEIQALIRQVVGQYTPQEIYTTKKGLIVRMLQDALGQIGQRYLTLDNLLIKQITLPPSIRQAIQLKLVEQQRFLEMKYRLERAAQEVKRKTIEAMGIRDYQKTIAQSLTGKILRFQGIQTILDLAQSPNARVVILNDKNGLPVILNPSTTNQISPPVVPSSETNLLGTNIFSLTNDDTAYLPYLTGHPQTETNRPNSTLPSASR